MFIDLREIERLVASCMHSSNSNGDWTRNLGMCPDQESNPQPFGVWDDAPTNLATWPGLILFFCCSCRHIFLVDQRVSLFKIYVQDKWLKLTLHQSDGKRDWAII